MRDSLPCQAQLRAMAGDRGKLKRCEQPIEIGERAATDKGGCAPAPRRKRLEGPLQLLRDLNAERRFGKIEERPIDIKQHRACSNVDCIDKHYQRPDVIKSQGPKRPRTVAGSLEHRARRAPFNRDVPRILRVAHVLRG